MTSGRRGLKSGGSIAAAIVVVTSIALATTARAAGPFSFSDGDFGSGWEVVDLTGTIGGSGSIGRHPTGGNPDAFWNVSFEGTSEGLVWQPVIWTGAKITPSTDGVIEELHFTYDARNRGTGDFSPFPALRQNGTIYAPGLGGGAGDSWGVSLLLGNTFTCASFGRISETGPLKPDCSLDAEPIEFGFVLLLFEGTMTQWIADIDNFRVEGVTSDAELTVSGTTKDPVDILDHGCVLVGTTSSKPITVENTGLPGSMLSGTFPSVASPHGPTSTQNFGPLAQGQTASRNYTFTATQRTGMGAGVTGTIESNGGSVLINFRGTPVAPLRSVDASGSDVGSVRIGTSGTAAVKIANTGDGNCSGAGTDSNLNGAIPAGQGSFAGAGGNFSIADEDDTTFTYTFTPTTHGMASQMLSITFENGSADGKNTGGTVNVTLSGTGVGPVFASTPAANGSIDFGTVTVGQAPTQNLTIGNETSDGVSFLTYLTLLSATLSGADAEVFALAGFTPDTVLEAGDMLPLTLSFAPTTPGVKTALLTIATDVNAAFGDMGTEFTYALQGTAVAPPEALKSFSPAIVVANAPLELQLTLANPADNPVALTGIAVTDPLPAGLRIATPNGLESDCGGTVVAPPGGDTVAISDVTLPPGASCTVTVTLVANAAGRYENVTSPVTANESAAGAAATAEVVVAVVPAPAASTAALALALLVLAGVAAHRLRAFRR